jgi:hypothetical protein
LPAKLLPDSIFREPNDFEIVNLPAGGGVSNPFGDRLHPVAVSSLSLTFFRSGSMSVLRRLSPLGLALLLLVGVSCSAGDSTGPISSDQQQPAPSFGLIGDLTGSLTNTVGDLTGTVVGTLGSVTDLLTCSPLPYDSETQTVGPDGGVITVGRNSLAIPSGALSQPVQITAEQIRGKTNSVRFSPEGLRFQKPAVLTMNYENCALVLVQKRIVYTDEQLKILEVLRSLDLFRARAVSAPIDHFSRYAIAY